MATCSRQRALPTHAAEHGVSLIAAFVAYPATLGGRQTGEVIGWGGRRAAVAVALPPLCDNSRQGDLVGVALSDFIPRLPRANGGRSTIPPMAETAADLSLPLSLAELDLLVRLLSDEMGRELRHDRAVRDEVAELNRRLLDLRGESSTHARPQPA